MSEVDRDGDGYIDMWTDPTGAVLERLGTASTDFATALRGAPVTNAGVGSGPLGDAFKAVVGKAVDEVKAAAGEVPPVYFELAGKGREAVRTYLSGDAAAASTLAADGGES
ncbi:hypothetical protein KZZ52_18730 [Dactylosporangium sp. AC04546]|uniref:hypothetical protein n=1 Tax=Dactylosporangium sp. AC04546 TaxID=2862460 RepID=UPI001EDD9596|nr:hypothetical protein [Dactylosporangium sp. AC04546]WVK87339.1 hypothetical protein KZZ52_18730 [Dactylosporangium sp. AC04546]